MFRRMRRRDWVVLAVLAGLAWWLAGLWPLTPGSRLPCAQTGSISPVGQIGTCISTLQTSVDGMRQAFCDSDTCEVTGDVKPNLSELDTLRATLDALPLGWATPALFPSPHTLSLDAGETLVLAWPGGSGDAVRVGRVHLSNNARLRLSTDLRTNLCTQTLTASAPSAPLVVASGPGSRLALTLTCQGNTPCNVSFDNQSSGDLPSDSQCQRKQ